MANMRYGPRGSKKVKKTGSQPEHWFVSWFKTISQPKRGNLQNLMCFHNYLFHTWDKVIGCLEVVDGERGDAAFYWVGLGCIWREHVIPVIKLAWSLHLVLFQASSKNVPLNKKIMIFEIFQMGWWRQYSIILSYTSYHDDKNDWWAEKIPHYKLLDLSCDRRGKFFNKFYVTRDLEVGELVR